MFDQIFYFGSGLCQLFAFQMMWEPWSCIFLPYQLIETDSQNWISFALYGFYVRGTGTYGGITITSDVPYILAYDAVACPSFLTLWGGSVNSVYPANGVLLSANICTQCLAALPKIGTTCIFIGLFSFLFFWFFSTFIERCNGCCCWKGGAITYGVTWCVIMIMFVLCILIFTGFAPCGDAITAYTTAYKLASPKALPGLNLAAAMLVETIFIILFLLFVRMPYTIIEAADKSTAMASAATGAAPAGAAPAYPQM